MAAMKSLPPNASPVRQTSVFTESTVPPPLLKSHMTKAGTWGRIVVLEGTLVYRILEPSVEEVTLTPGVDGVVEPQVPHEVVPGPGVRFYVEFCQAAD
jgi:tellurite resistance-related uncharacterized protein